MTHEEMIAVITAHKEGKSIEFRRTDGGIPKDWTLCPDVRWSFNVCEYRVKPESTYRSYNDADECFAEIKKHGGWVKGSYSNRLFFVTGVCIFGVNLPCSGNSWLPFKELLEDYVWADDDTPCGMKEG